MPVMSRILLRSLTPDRRRILCGRWLRCICLGAELFVPGHERRDRRRRFIVKWELNMQFIAYTCDSYLHGSHQAIYFYLKLTSDRAFDQTIERRATERDVQEGAFQRRSIKIQDRRHADLEPPVLAAFPGVRNHGKEGLNLVLIPPGSPPGRNRPVLAHPSEI